MAAQFVSCFLLGRAIDEGAKMIAPRAPRPGPERRPFPKGAARGREDPPAPRGTRRKVSRPAHLRRPAERRASCPPEPRRPSVG
eukprot:5861779-Pyramimonas_sp.AAC.1